MSRTTRADGLATGPRDPVRETPPRRPGSVRRTTTVDQRFGDVGGRNRVVGLGRDLRTHDDDTAEVIDTARVDAVVSGAGIVLELASDPPLPPLHELLGAPVQKGLRARVEALVPDEVSAGTVSHQLLDDLPMAQLIASYGTSRERPDFRLPPESAERLADICAGWVRGGTMLFHLGDTGIFPIPVGPVAPALDTRDDRLAWHELPALEPRTVRRRRRLDVSPRADGGFEVDVHFRDSHLGADGPEDVLHEYTLAVVVDAELVVVSSSAEARTLPWPECPGSLGSASRIVGHPVSVLRPLVLDGFKGTSTCTHLNDALRSLAGVTALVAAVG